MRKLIRDVTMRKLILDARKYLAKKLAENKLGDTTCPYSEEEKKEQIENAKLAQLNWRYWA